ncbi:hypothetical protein RBH29_08470 [Herbivorax sp. ANBcel31]|uniref:hypothetical protein n=1 Tax=Herbivorax sp. ANBcel31 TaxID=3069754 RepID=UPI0027B837E7|nr:hypothetical protein [Herbivorax sp. ANBcel31]MDQ2086461.1 hypothetical protein [Herbivorax sp. ANBcel31]
MNGYNENEQQLMEDLGDKAINVYEEQSPNFFLALFGGMVTALICSALWAFISNLIQYQIGWMAVGVGFLVGISVKVLGKGKSLEFGILGASLALLSCVLGNSFSIYAQIAKFYDMSFFEVLGNADLSISIELLIESFHLMDILFYGLAIYQGFKFSISN